MMDQPKTRMITINTSVIFTVLFVGFLYVCITQLNPAFLFQSFHSQPSTSAVSQTNATVCRDNVEEKQANASTNSHINKTIVYKDDLEEALAKASTKDKTVIITVINNAYVEGDKPMLDMFLDGFWLGEGTRHLREHLLIVAVDQEAFERCKFLKLHCYKLVTEGMDFSGEKLFMSKIYVQMMWRRLQFLGDVLKYGYNFIFTDTDILWLRDPFKSLVLDGSVDLQFSTDWYNGDQWSLNNFINAGYYMVKSNNRTIAFFDEWYGWKDNSTGRNEQDIVRQMMREGVTKRLGLRARFLDTKLFSGFCNDSKDVTAVTTIHANCCRHISAKIADMTKTIHDWKKYRLSPNDTTKFSWSKHEACKNSWKN